MSLLGVSELSVTLGRHRAVDGVTLSVEPGECVGLIGPNGAGKTTLLRAALGLLPAGGARSLGGAALSTLPAAERARRAAYLPQAREIAWSLTVETIVGLGRLPHRGLGAGLSRADRAAIDRAMARMDVAGFAARPATTLSGGEHARVLLARALAQETPLLIADEPTAGLDPAHQIAAMETFAALAREGRGAVVSLHDLGLAARWCTRLVLMERGCVVADGPPDAVLTPERLAATYGVTAYRAEAGGAPVIMALGRI